MRSGSALRSPYKVHRRAAYRPRFEALESRDCPAGMAPSISFTIVPAGPTTFTLSGTVMDEAPDGLIVNFSGVYTGSTQAGSTGNFSVTVTPNQLGVVTAECMDNEGLTATPVQRSCSSTAPMISLSASRQVNNVWVFSGMVTDEHAAGLTVRFGGLPSLANRTATVGSNGMYSLTVELEQGEEGTATAQTTDWWGIDSNLAAYIVQPSA